ncbi:MAG: DUF1003 domain-containing protein, partial [Acidobacteria bacterium]|nr:DUF1003 domain-containing protein [Acidobacteriota bacterium]
MNKSSGAASRVCQVCGSSRTADLLPAVVVRPPVANLIRRDTGRWDEAGSICQADLQRFRHQYVEEILLEEKGEITQLEQEVLDSLREHEILASNPVSTFDSKLTVGERLADRIAAFGGSWAFIMSFAAVLFAWMFVNSYLLAGRPFDPYPYILLNLFLSCLAAVQAPIIMMSQ